jgi:hypothetical protein
MTDGQDSAASRFLAARPLLVAQLGDLGWLDPAAAEQLRTERDEAVAEAELSRTEARESSARCVRVVRENAALINLREAAKAWREYVVEPESGGVTAERIAAEALTERKLIAAVDALPPTDGET